MSKPVIISARFAPSTRVRFVPERDFWSTALEIAAAHLPPALEVDATLADAPHWVPRSVRLLAKQNGLNSDICRRLLTDPRLKNTWRWMLRQNVKDAQQRIDTFNDQGKLSK